MRPFLIALALTCAAAAAAAQTSVPFGGFAQDTGAPVELEAESLRIEEGGARAVMSGGVVIAQGEMRLAAQEVTVEYREGRIQRILAAGDVILTQGEDAAEAQEADYDVDRGTVVLTGDVLVSQAGAAIQAQRATVDLVTGDAVMEGRVRTVLGGQ